MGIYLRPQYTRNPKGELMIQGREGKYTVNAESEEEADLTIAHETSRHDKIRDLMSQLVVKSGVVWQKFMYATDVSQQKIDMKLHTNRNPETSISINSAKIQRMGSDNEGYLYNLEYVCPVRSTDFSQNNEQERQADFVLAREIARLMIHPSNKYCCKPIQENVISLLAELALKGEQSVDNIIKGQAAIPVDNPYKRSDELLRLLIQSMGNDFVKEMTAEQLGSLKLDEVLKSSSGTIKPYNIFLYGILNDPSIIQKEYNKYMGIGAWKKLNRDIEVMYSKGVSEGEIKDIENKVRESINDFDENRIQGKDISSLSLKQKVAQYLQRNNIFMKLPFVKKFVDRQLKILPKSHTDTFEGKRIQMVKQLRNTTSKPKKEPNTVPSQNTNEGSAKTFFGNR